MMTKQVHCSDCVRKVSSGSSSFVICTARLTECDPLTVRDCEYFVSDKHSPIPTPSAPIAPSRYVLGHLS